MNRLLFVGRGAFYKAPLLVSLILAASCCFAQEEQRAPPGRGSGEVEQTRAFNIPDNRMDAEEAQRAVMFMVYALGGVLLLYGIIKYAIYLRYGESKKAPSNTPVIRSKNYTPPSPRKPRDEHGRFNLGADWNDTDD